ncbi:MAG: hypothetical protein ABJJ53_12315 [Sulfitobacter sp.]
MDDKIAHLGMIQDVITRMAEESARTKNYCLTMFGILATASVAAQSEFLVALGVIMGLLFWGMDARYLLQERWYRALFDHARSQRGAADFNMVPSSELRQQHSVAAALFGPSVLAFYGTITFLLVGLGAVLGDLPAPALP